MALRLHVHPANKPPGDHSLHAYILSLSSLLSGSNGIHFLQFPFYKFRHKWESLFKRQFRRRNTFFFCKLNKALIIYSYLWN